MANTLATEEWPEIRRLAEQGLTFSALSARFGVKEDTIRKRASKDGWLTTKGLQIEIASALERSKAQNPSGCAPLSPRGSEILAETWQERANNLRNLSFTVAEQAIRESKGRIVIESASDLKHAVHVARQATGLLDADAPQVQLSIFGAGNDTVGPPTLDSYVENVESSSVVIEDDDLSL